MPQNNPDRSNPLADIFCAVAASIILEAERSEEGTTTVFRYNDLTIIRTPCDNRDMPAVYALMQGNAELARRHTNGSVSLGKGKTEDEVLALLAEQGRSLGLPVSVGIVAPGMLDAVPQPRAA